MFALVEIPTEIPDGEKRGRYCPLDYPYLHVTPRRDAFITSASTVLLSEASAYLDEMTHERQEAQTTMAVLSKKQRHRTVHYPVPYKLPFISRYGPGCGTQDCL